MTRPKKGEPGHEEAVLRTRETMAKKFGSAEAAHEFYRKIGKKGGMVICKKGFAIRADLARQAGANGGKKSMRGYKLIKEDEYTRWYKRRETGEIVKYLYDVEKDKYVPEDRVIMVEGSENETRI